MASPFRWTTFDLGSRLPEGWREDVAAAVRCADVREFPRTPILSREAEDVSQIRRGRVHADQVRSVVPWLLDLYQGYFLELAGTVYAEPVRPAADDRYGVVLNVQRGAAMRFECHIDSNPLTGLLFCTDHPADGGGDLVVANDVSAVGVAAIERDCTVIRPYAGQLIFFDGSQHPHYARALSSESDTRVVAIMNYYTRSRPESTRPLELNRHLYGPDADTPRVKIQKTGYIQRLRRKVPAGVL
jgi:hypothetical protein